MCSKFATMAILLAIASSGNARPRDPDPLDSSSSQEVAPEPLEGINRTGTLDSRYMMTKRQVSSTLLTSDPGRDISITSIKFNNSSDNSNGLKLSILPGLSINTIRKNYLSLGIPSFAISRTNNLKSINKNTRQSRNINSNNYNPLTIPIISSPKAQIILPMPISVSRKNEIIITNLTSRIPTIKSIPLLRQTFDSTNLNSILRDKRMMSRNFVRIIPQKVSTLKLGYDIRTNLTNLKNKPQITNVQLKNWPNEAFQNVQDLLNYEKYTSLTNDNLKVPFEKFNLSSKYDESIKSPEIQYPLNLSQLPVINAQSTSNDRIDINSMIHIDSLLDDLKKNNINKQHHNGLSEVTQNTVFHILNIDPQKSNASMTKPMNVNYINRTRIGNNRPPQNVHIMFMDKDESLLKNKTLGKNTPPKKILGTDTDCPTITINSITQINNTIENKEGCTDLNIIINSHILNTNIFKPNIDSSFVTLFNNSQETAKNPYSDASEIPLENYENNSPSNNYYNNNNNNPNNNYNENVEFIEPVHDTSSYEVFQGTQINIGENNQAIEDISNSAQIENFFNVPKPDEFTSTNINVSPISNTDNGNSVIISSNTEDDFPISQVNQFSEAASVIDNVGTGQANDAVGTISLPGLSNLQAVPGELINSVSNGNNGVLAGSAQTNLSPTSTLDSDDDDDDELLEALSPAGLLESISSVFTYFSILNPINYGIFSIAVAPFIAFAAGILGIAAFLFPWAFPGNFDFSRGWNDNSNKLINRFNTNLRDIVQSSIYKYKRLNEWKGKRKKKRKR